MSNKNLLSIGQALKERRESQKIPLKKIADQTRINISTLTAIEEGQISAFPVHAYLRGFILAYVKALDLNAKEWEEELKFLSPTEENAHLSEVAGAGRPAEVLIEKDMRLTPVILATLILFILGSILVLSNILNSHKEKKQSLSQNDPFFAPQEKKLNNPSRSEKKEKATPSAEKRQGLSSVQPDTKKPLEEKSNADNKNNSNVKADTTKLPEKTSSESENLQALSPDSATPLKQPPTALPTANKNEIEIIVKALEEVRVHYQVDQGETKSALLTEDQFKVLKGKKTIFIKTRHSDLIYIFYNGKDLGLFGSGGKKEQSFSLIKTPNRKDEE